MKAEESAQKVEQVPLSGSLCTDGRIDFANTKKRQKEKERRKGGKEEREDIACYYQSHLQNSPHQASGLCKEWKMRGFFFFCQQGRRAEAKSILYCFKLILHRFLP